MPDHYATLGVARTATADEIKRAFRRLASQHHPDKGGDTKKFQEIQAAYDTLGDAAKRQQYDNPQPQFAGFPGGAQFNMGDIFSQMFGQGVQNARRNHVRMTIWVSLKESIQGGSKTVAVSTTAGANTVQIDVPPGINDGDNVQYGGVAPGGMDLVIQFRIQPDPNWRRNNLDLSTEKTIPIWDFILGNDIEIENILGSILVTQMPARTQPGSIMRLRGQGIKDRQGHQGDLLIKLNAQIPTSIAPEIIDAIQQYRT
jgi:DnaJ-class molecular chaperone